MNSPESMKNDETKKIFDLQVLSACIKQPGAITYFAEHINPDDVGKIHGYMGIHEFYKALLNLFKETKLDPIDINAAKGWILAETDIADALGGEPGLASFLAELDVLDTAEYTSIVKIVAARAKKRKQLDHVQKMKEEIQKLDTSPDEISKLTDQIRILAKELDNNPMEKVRTADHIAAGIDELWEIPPFLPTQFPQLNRAMGYCLDPETEILTSRGWLRYNEIDAEQETILAFSEDDNILRWEKLQGLYVDENYDGPMI